MSDYVYEPNQFQLKDFNIVKFALSEGIESIEELYERADKDRTWFWHSVVEDLGIRFWKPYTKVFDSSQGKEWTKWYVDGGINIVDTCILSHAHSERVAISFERENGENGTITFRELDDMTARLGRSLQKLGVSKGDRVGIYMPLNPECVVAMYSILRIGAVAVPIFSGYGRDALKKRVEDAGIRVIFTTNAYERKGKKVAMIENVRGIEDVKLIIQNPVILNNNEFDFRDLLEEEPLNGYEKTMSEDPAIILYTSGTTGRPKGTVHVHGGSFVNIVKEVKYYLDFKQSDTLFWITDLGWMMGPWAILGANALGGSIFVYDGAVDFPTDTRVWDLVERNSITILGLSPTYVRMLKQKGIDRRMHGIRVFASTGEPWDDDSWLWLFEKIGGSITPISNISGGTDIIGCFLASAPYLPLKPRCLYRGLGMNVSVFDDSGRDIVNSIGYLVAKEHCPSMTRGIWNNSSKYIETYWSKFKGVWNHGDWALMDKDGYFYLFGRSDDVMKIAGKRLGPNEVENIVSEVKGVVECAAVGIPDRIKGEALAVFYVGDGAESVRRKIESRVTEGIGKSFRPLVINVPNIPKTRNGKIMRRVLRNAFTNRDSGDISGLEDAAVIKNIQDLGKNYVDAEGYLVSKGH
ncbi:MAG: AMP-binding protein [Candidatus Thermoplasmatota archaeon]|nr:AMP-binding protein [Candidatus Thermoplasmatota archaeon]